MIRKQFPVLTVGFKFSYTALAVLTLIQCYRLMLTITPYAGSHSSYM